MTLVLCVVTSNVTVVLSQQRVGDVLHTYIQTHTHKTPAGQTRSETILTHEDYKRAMRRNKK